jgi:type IV pilus assembly protein PilW
VRSIEVALVASGMRPLASLSDSEMAYTSTLDDITTPVPPANHQIKPDVDQGFEKKLLRREFTALLAIRNFNP